MHQIALHNALSMLLAWLNANGAALKLIPNHGAGWSSVDVSVGDLTALHALNWREGETPALDAHDAHAGETQTIFGHACMQIFCPHAELVIWQIEVTEDLLRAMPSQFLHFEKRNTPSRSLGSLWLALEASPDVARQAAHMQATPLAEYLFGVAAQSLWGLYQSSQRHIEPTSQLPDAAEFRSRLQLVLERQAEHSDPGMSGVGVVLIGVDDYARLRRAEGNARAASLIRSVAAGLGAALRKDDELFCYREAQFVVAGQFQDETACRRVAEKLMQAFRDVSEHETCKILQASVGYVFNDGANTAVGTDAHALCMCAEQALDHASLIGGDRIISFTGTFDSDEYILTHPLGALISDPAREQRNTRILWQTVALINAESEPDALCHGLQDLLDLMLEDCTTLLLGVEDGDIVSLCKVDELQLRSAHQRLIREALSGGRTQHHSDVEAGDFWLAVPLKSHSRVHGALLLLGAQAFDAADQVFFKCLADQLAGALDRAELITGRLHAQQAETKELRAQLSQLTRRAPVPTQVAHSPAMQEVLTLVDRIAPTDVSVLIVGESGAGKEVMAHTIHQASDRAEAPMVVVDCSAITHSLIDSELFGRVKGAFTGADDASAGRIAQAQGGTLFLDEIGELPLDVQSKLLRFVQEKEVIAVGGTQPQIIDTRIMCATNRNLLAEVEAGRFRADLYYRLQVIQVAVPPLRQRREDLPDIVQNLLAQFAVEFSKPIDDLSTQAWQRVLAYPWPGNVRELHNTLLRAALAARSDTIEIDDIQFNGDLSIAQDPSLVPAQQSAPQSPVADAASGTSPAAAPQATGPESGAFLRSDEATNADQSRYEDTAPAQPASDNPWQSLARLVRLQLEALAAENLTTAPLGRWLTDTLVLTALEFGAGITRSAARVLGVPETTLRRQIARAHANENNPLFMTSQAWQNAQASLRALLLELLSEDVEDGLRAQAIEDVVLSEVAHHADGNIKHGAALLGVTPPTFQRRVAALDTHSHIPNYVSGHATSPASDQRQVI